MTNKAIKLHKQLQKVDTQLERLQEHRLTTVAQETKLLKQRRIVELHILNTTAEELHKLAQVPAISPSECNAKVANAFTDVINAIDNLLTTIESEIIQERVEEG